MLLRSVHYLPIATTMIAAVLACALLRRYRMRRRDGAPALHLLWWGIGAVIYGAGTALESVATVAVNSAALTKAWYVTGAVLGGYPLAQGSVFLLASPTTARRLTQVTLPVAAIIGALVIASPIDAALLDPHRPSGAALEWTWVRGLTPILNLYAVAFLTGGAALSAWRYARTRSAGSGVRAAANTAIAVGSLLPAIGGAIAKSGTIEALYVGELIGLALIAAGFAAAVHAPSVAPRRTS